ncbi:MAG TPA: pyridoxine 5'-phosphate synthase [Bacteroidales bacterium]|jgi:pyridoxine 5-phosphate synthase|nr:pyridoxine 5'-phosphate synthase [Bacteroidales bacterium]MDD4235561.1 pyridoxine 5'-phosphate synthase [Bacteroidales bacterium]MDY0159854.1 pyridoxine 5'-phosphate synthase [Bacteroidales bacterium]HXK81523.1 pyridoxine 5'-phosphate synthase [Bacteroidales bacterium]
MTRLSVNINKIATIRNARGGNIPDVLQAAINCEAFGADGITVHPRPDERHIRYADVIAIKPIIKTEFNIEGYPTGTFLDLVTKVLPHQVTLVPDPPDVLTSNSGWQITKNMKFLKETIRLLKSYGIRTSIFVDTDLENIKYAAETGTDRVELYTEPYAANFITNKLAAIEPFIKAAEQAVKTGLELNAGHDLNLDNLSFFKNNIPGLAEVSIGHALISDALYLGLENTINLYKRALRI